MVAIPSGLRRGLKSGVDSQTGPSASQAIAAFRFRRPTVALGTRCPLQWGVFPRVHWAVVIGLIWFATGACSRDPQTTAPAGASPISTNGDTAKPGEEFRESLPREGGPEGYVGSAACKSCHEDQFASWHRTYHRTMTQYATPATVRANFDNQVLTNQGVRFSLSRKEHELRVRMERLEPAANSDGPPAAMDTRVGLVTGSHHMQVFWVPGGDGNTQIGFPFTWLIPEARWVPRNSTFVRPPGFQHSSEIWNVTCSRCHSTGVEPRVDVARHIMDSQAAEMGISCEACHGPGARHVQARRAAPAGEKPETASLRGEIVHPEKLDAKRSSEVCGFCHSMKWIDRNEPWRDRGFRFRPGDDLEATTPLIQPHKVDQLPALKDYLARNPDLLADYFWSDGMGRVSGREYNSVAASPCFQGGKFSCLSCHSLHESEPEDLLAANRQDNRACLQCHPAFGTDTALTAHTHHAVGSSGSECYNCHMPHTTYGVLSAIRSHQISSPRVADQLATGRPNACSLCHLDRPLRWVETALTAWFQQPTNQLDSAQETVAEGARLALTGDAGQRALTAWHLGWKPARDTSGTDWMTPLLGALLDDPYAAVRCLAERSLRTSPGLMPTDYDFVAEPDSRISAAEDVWRRWLAARKPESTAPEPFSGPWTTPAEITTRLRPLLEARNQRPMRLRE